MSAVLAQRAALQAAQPELRLTPGAWFVAATARALQAHPWLNAEWRADGIFLHHAYHIGLAVALDEGLIVPVIRDVDRRDLPDLARQLMTWPGAPAAASCNPTTCRAAPSPSRTSGPVAA